MESNQISLFLIAKQKTRCEEKAGKRGVNSLLFLPFCLKAFATEVIKEAHASWKKLRDSNTNP
jgi:hypothetical protein